jgi:amino acid permease
VISISAFNSFSFFVVVATILGTDILALPVKVGETGFYPFLVQFAVCAIMQCFILIYMVELLQKTAAHTQATLHVNYIT